MRKQKIKSHFLNGKQDFIVSLVAIKQYIDQYTIPHLDSIDVQIKKDYQALFNKPSIEITALDHYFKYNPSFMNYIQKLIKTRRLAYTLSESISTIIALEGEITPQIEVKQKIQKSPLKLLRLTNDNQQINSLLQESKMQ